MTNNSESAKLMKNAAEACLDPARGAPKLQTAKAQRNKQETGRLV